MKILFSLLLCVAAFPLSAEKTLDSIGAETLVRNFPCQGESTVDQQLQKIIKKRSQRDLGWRVFFENQNFDVERAILVNKSMRIRYRWRVDPARTVTPMSKRATKLCSG